MSRLESLMMSKAQYEAKITVFDINREMGLNRNTSNEPRKHLERRIHLYRKLIDEEINNIYGRKVI